MIPTPRLLWTTASTGLSPKIKFFFIWRLSSRSRRIGACRSAYPSHYFSLIVWNSSALTSELNIICPPPASLSCYAHGQELLTFEPSPPSLHLACGTRNGSHTSKLRFNPSTRLQIPTSGTTKLLLNCGPRTPKTPGPLLSTPSHPTPALPVGTQGIVFTSFQTVVVKAWDLLVCSPLVTLTLWRLCAARWKVDNASS